ESDEEQTISIDIADDLWFGIGNSTKNMDEEIITFFDGIGKDGNGDGKADPDAPEDALYTMASMLLTYGQTEDDIKIDLWNYYEHDLIVQTFMSTSIFFKKLPDIHLSHRDFPVGMYHNYCYRITWGDSRGFGGFRIHEGTDIVAGYGTPVKSTTYG